ncbi:MAG: hypothetical protein HY821_06985 [Acidobacteria bacterium]|nr:hypothetical protein [Acidobacteriota bacterium]
MSYSRVVVLACASFLLSSGRERPGGLQAGSWNGQPIQYKVRNGWAVVEGDILLAPVSEVALAPRGKDGGGRASSAVTSQLLLWDGGVIPYVIEEGFPLPARVRDAIKHWEEKTPLRFVERTNEVNYVTFEWGFDGCYSTVGNRGPASVVSLELGCGTKETVHEIGHVVGLFHTQSRIDRDRYIRVRYDNVDRLSWPQYTQHITDGKDVGPYDYGSIMHYPTWGFSSNGGPTMQTVPAGIPVGEATALSALDIRAVHVLYGKAFEKCMISSTPAGLKVVVDGNEAVTPAEFSCSEGETHTVSALEKQGDGANGRKYEFANWSDGGEREHTFTVSAEQRVLDARFRQRVRVSAVNVAGEGVPQGRFVLEPRSEDGFYVPGTRVRIQALAEEGTQFLDWKQMEKGADVFSWRFYGTSPNPLALIVGEAPVELTGRFTEGPVTEIVADSPSMYLSVDGKYASAPARFAWKPGSTHTVLALWGSDYTGARDYEFKLWQTPDGTSDRSGLPWLAGDKSAQLRVATETWFYLDAVVDYYISGGTRPSANDFTFSPADDYGYFLAGSEVEVTAPSQPMWKLVNWYGDGAGKDSTLRLRLDEPKVVIGNFLSFGYLNPGSIVNDATRQPDVLVPGARLRIYWQGMNPEAPVSAPEGEPLPTSLGGVEVRFNNRERCGLLSVSKEEVLCVVPETIRGEQNVSVQVVNGRLGATSVDLGVLSRSPGIYTVDGSGHGRALDRAVRAGELVEVTATGLGEGLTTKVSLGEADLDPEEVSRVEGRPGVWRVTFRVPEGTPTGAAAIFLICDGRASQPGVTLEVSGN